ncbi:unnamed protein product, partial [Scytosiphon promiscuus]
QVESSKQACDLLSEGNRKRITASTSMNQASSRSHVIFAVDLKAYAEEAYAEGGRPEIWASRLTTVDLAGKELHSKTL